MKLVLHCLRCGHDWLRRSLTALPKQCPRCHSPYWNKKRVRETASRT
jgi:predicted Zn-ribbon and HTH transcriptional regulator